MTLRIGDRVSYVGEGRRLVGKGKLGIITGVQLSLTKPRLHIVKWDFLDYSLPYEEWLLEFHSREPWRTQSLMGDKTYYLLHSTKVELDRGL